MSKRIHYGVGAHEPIFHRLRTGNSIAEEWKRWERETSPENLSVLEDLGVDHVHIACTKGFGLEYEKPLIERAADFARRAAERGISTSAYVQGFPVYYETFLLEVPEAEDWLARNQAGDYIPWGAHTFRRWMDPTRREFLDYQYKVFDYILERFHPVHFGLDNTVVAPVYTKSSLASWRDYLKNKFTEEDAYREFGIKSFDAVDLPHFDFVYYPPDAMKTVKDPLLQEWAYWRAFIVDDFCTKLLAHIRSRAPEIKLSTSSGCDGLRYNLLFNRGIDFESRIEAVDSTGMEESGWRPGVVEVGKERELTVVMDERTPDSALGGEKVELRVSTDARFVKISGNYGMKKSLGFWGEHSREDKLVAASHNMAFAWSADNIGSIGPLAAHPKMLDDLKDVVEWGNVHIDILVDRAAAYAPIAVWRGKVTTAFIRHRPVWEACVIEQSLFENHYPFTIIFDEGLERFLDYRKVMILPGTQCVSDRQVEIITDFVQRGGKLLLLGASGTRDERTRIRKNYAFEHLFGGSLPELELIGPPHWVPYLDFKRMPETLTADYGSGKVAMVRDIKERFPLDLTRDPYMPERQVMVKDIIPPANEADIIESLEGLLTDNEIPRLHGPRWTLSEYWKLENGSLLVTAANLRKGKDGGPVTLNLGPFAADSVETHMLFEKETRKLEVKNGSVTLDKLPHFAGLVIKCSEDAWEK